MKILLTGGAGYVGSGCLRYLLRNGHDPIAFDNLSEGNQEAVPEGRLLVGDIQDPDALTQAMGDHGVEAEPQPKRRCPIDVVSGERCGSPRRPMSLATTSRRA